MSRYVIEIKEIGHDDFMPYCWRDSKKEAMIAVRKAILWELYSSKFRITDTQENKVIYDTTRGA
jgi:hypothetical protein